LPAVKYWLEEQELNIRSCNLDKFAEQKNPILPKGCMVDVAGIWGEGCYSYPERSEILKYQKLIEAAILGWHSILLSTL